MISLFARGDWTHDKKRILDVWIVEINKVYREVPFAVVTDWLQQGRLLARRQGAPGGRQDLARSQQRSGFRAVSAACSKTLAVEDAAEALEAVDLGFEPTRRLEDEDEDVDMIPLIDISLVLLIFFMMTATVKFRLFVVHQHARSQDINWRVPAANSFWVGIDTKSGGGKIEKGPDGKPLPWFSFGKDNQQLQDPTTDRGFRIGRTRQNARRLRRRGQHPPACRPRLAHRDYQGHHAGITGFGGKPKSHAQKGKLKFAIMGEVSEPVE